MSCILIIEDEKALLGMIKMALTKLGHDVETAGDGEEGVRKFSEKPFDLVITDIRMPRLDGRGVLRYIRNSERRLTPVIGISGTPWMLEDDEFDAVLQKPFMIQTLADYIRTLVMIPQQTPYFELNATLL